MIYGKLWCVVKPSVGIPLFLSAVAVSSFAVHLALLNTAPWLRAYYAGNTKATATAAAPAAAESPPAAMAAAPKKP